MKCNYTLENNTLTVSNLCFMHSIPNIDSATAHTVSDTLSEPYLEVVAKRGEKTHTYRIWEDIPILYMPDYDEESLFTLEGEHWIARSVKLHAFTDENDTLTTETERHVFRQRIHGGLEGDMFFLEDMESARAYTVVSDDPDFVTAKLTVSENTVRVENGGVGLAIGFAEVGRCEELARAYYRHAKAPLPLVTMSNTWGDCNGYSRVSRDFIIREIDAAKEIGVDIVQIDDGWQTGNTDDKTRRDELGRREFSGNFWDLRLDRFPNGMREVTDYATERGIKVGMWFAPDSHGDFALLDRDTEVLRRAYDEWGIRFFKLDMFWVSTDAERRRFLELLRRIYSFGNDVSVQLDVTRNLRMNYLSGKEYGTVFVENRYTKTANSFPHRILRNLWSLSKYIPTSKFQFELVNPDLNKESYAETDPLAPSNYSMDYLFATVMLSNPLFWMEMQFLPENRRAELRDIMGVFREHRDRLARLDVRPIGDKPSGRSFTGFAVTGGTGNAEYLLIFRELTDSDEAKIKAPIPKGASAQLLATNSTGGVRLDEGEISIRLDNPRSYAFIRVIKK